MTSRPAPDFFSTLGLTDAERAARRNSIGGSDANTIMCGDPARILRLWKEKAGLEKPQDLNGELPVAMGSWTEELNRQWFQRETGKEVTDQGKRFTSDKYDWLTATADGITESLSGEPAVFEAKHIGRFDYSDTNVLSWYMPQLQHNMFVVGCDYAVLSVFVGTDTWKYFVIEFDPFVHSKILAAEMKFWNSIKDKAPPLGRPNEFIYPVKVGVEIVDMGNDIEWKKMADDFLKGRSAMAKIKSNVPKNVDTMFGHGICAKRDKRGVVWVREDEGYEKTDDATGV